MMKEDALFVFSKKDLIEKLLSDLFLELFQNNFQKIWLNFEKKLPQSRLLRTLAVLDISDKKSRLRDLDIPAELIEWLNKIDINFLSFFRAEFQKMFIQSEKQSSGVQNEWKDLRSGTFSFSQGVPLIELEIHFEDNIVKTRDFLWSILMFAVQITKGSSEFLKSNFEQIPDTEKKLVAEHLNSFYYALPELKSLLHNIQI